MLHTLRIGCVKYLNARPLIEGYDGPVIFDHPSALAEGIATGTLDVGLIPIFEALGHRDYIAVDGVAIASDGPVYSVFLAHRKPLHEIRSIALDPGSLTSVHLLKVLLAEYLHLNPVFVTGNLGLDAADAQLLIGNQAIEFRRAQTSGVNFLDLGEEWQRHTGLPFVFAVWLLRPNLPDAERVAAGFQALQRYGLAHLDEIIAQDPAYDPQFRRQYLGHYIRYGLASREREAIEKFRLLLVKHGLVSADSHPLKYTGTGWPALPEQITE